MKYESIVETERVNGERKWKECGGEEGAKKRAEAIDKWEGTSRGGF